MVHGLCISVFIMVLANMRLGIDFIPALPHNVDSPTLAGGSIMPNQDNP
jgi:hypothetical protein